MIEIREQPEALERTLQGGLREAVRFARTLRARQPKWILLAARGTSDNAAQFGRYLLEITTGIPVSLAAPSIFTLYHARIRLEDAMVVAISPAGTATPYLRRISLAWYSWIFMGTPELLARP